MKGGIQKSEIQLSNVAKQKNNQLLQSNKSYSGSIVPYVTGHYMACSGVVLVFAAAKKKNNQLMPKHKRMATMKGGIHCCKNRKTINQCGQTKYWSQ